MTVKAQFVKDYVVYNDKEYKGQDPLGRLCRDLAALGYGDMALECYRGNMLCITVPKIIVRAGYMLRENDEEFRYQPYTRSSYCRIGI